MRCRTMIYVRKKTQSFYYAHWWKYAVSDSR